MSSFLADHREHRKNVRLISKTKVASEGAGQIIVDNKTAYISHMESEGVTLVDVKDPLRPSVLSKVKPPYNTHSHKVQVSGDIMIVNNEQLDKKISSWTAGMRVFDISDKRSPREISFMRTGGRGVHRMWFVDGKYAHITAHPEGFTDCIYQIIDMQRPEAPQVISNFWLPGMWKGGGEVPTWKPGSKIRAHGPAMVVGNRAYLGWSDGGFTIIDVSDLYHPKMVSHCNLCPPFGGLTHTVLPMPERKIMIVTDEAFVDNCKEPEKLAWIVDIREETNPIPIATIQVESEGFAEKEGRFGSHNIHECRPGSLVDDQLVYITYFNGGLRIIDIQDPYRPKEVGYFIPAKPEGSSVIQTNDVFVDSDELIYIVDRFDGTLYILEYTGPR